MRRSPELRLAASLVGLAGLAVFDALRSMACLPLWVAATVAAALGCVALVLFVASLGEAERGS